MRTFFVAMWRAILVRGVTSLVFGILAFVYPGVTLSLLLAMFGIYVLLDGVIGLWSVIRGTSEKGRFAVLLQSILGVVIGLVCLIFPTFAIAYLVLLIGLWYMAAGIVQLAGSIVLRRELAHWFLLGLSGLAAVALGLLIVLYPSGAALSIVWIIAGTAVLTGIILIVFAWFLRSAATNLQRQ